jgi:hypothetical protein
MGYIPSIGSLVAEPLSTFGMGEGRASGYIEPEEVAEDVTHSLFSFSILDSYTLSTTRQYVFHFAHS